MLELFAARLVVLAPSINRLVRLRIQINVVRRRLPADLRQMLNALLIHLAVHQPLLRIRMINHLDLVATL